MHDSRSVRQLALCDTGGLLVNVEAPILQTEASLIAVALALGAQRVAGWSTTESALLDDLPFVPPKVVKEVREQVLAGLDPLGDAFCAIRAPAERREQGATYTPRLIVGAMVEWAAEFDKAARVIDPGTGSGRYLLKAGATMPGAELIGIEFDPLPAIIARANLATAGYAERSKIILSDYRSADIPKIHGKTLYIGNPPYVRHHRLNANWKRWLTDEATKLGHEASQLAGLHVHFFLATAIKATHGDFGAFITAAEWLDVNYGRLVRDLFLSELGGQRIVVIEPTAMPFPDAATTAAITYFAIGAKPKTIKLKRIDQLKSLAQPNGNRLVRRERLEAERRWSHLTRPVRKGPAGFVELGELFRVHRGQVTGLNKVWIASSLSIGLPESVLFPSVTKARELFKAGKVLSDASALRKVIDLPADLDAIDNADRPAIDKFLARAKASGADTGYVAHHRRAWWAVGLRQPAPILSTYMARRPPAFVRNRANARHINIAHGFYPREQLTDLVMTSVIDYLSKAVCVTEGRTYAGGLTKFEPREMERLMIPGLELLIRG